MKCTTQYQNYCEELKTLSSLKKWVKKTLCLKIEGAEHMSKLK